jgi:hypothetical protein
MMGLDRRRATGTGKRRCDPKIDWSDVYVKLADAARNKSAVTGWTHNFYRYPARFSPGFAATAIRCLSSPSDLILDPYMGGGTAVVEAAIAGRPVVGNDLNSLAAFVTRVKTTILLRSEVAVLNEWASDAVSEFSYSTPAEELASIIDVEKSKNLSLVRARFIKKAIAAALTSIVSLPTINARNFAKCVILRVGQWALDGRRRHTPLKDFRKRLSTATFEMVSAINAFEQHSARSEDVIILNDDTSLIDHSAPFYKGRKASLVITSPPYPGVHVLYHRWQVDGRRETPAPYWIAGCQDGNGASFYNFGDRREGAADKYFRTSLQTLSAIRRVVRDGGYMVQMLAFNNADDQLPRYLQNMEQAGFAEVRVGKPRIWRSVPHRKWHANLIGITESANEVVLIHQAV